jgi:hypothetical protein
VPSRPSLLRRAATVAGALSLLTALAACSDGGGSSSAGDPDLFCDAAREAFAGTREFDFGDPAQRQQIVEVFDRMAEYAPGDISSEVDATRDAVEEYADKASELEQLQSELDASEGETLSEDAIAEIQDLVTEIESDTDLVRAREAIEPYLDETCALDVNSTVTTVAPGTAPADGATLETTTTAP